MGYSLREYERRVPRANREFHEQAELAVCYKEGVLPLEDDDAEDVEKKQELADGTTQRAARSRNPRRP